MTVHRSQQVSLDYYDEAPLGVAIRRHLVQAGGIFLAFIVAGGVLGYGVAIYRTHQELDDIAQNFKSFEGSLKKCQADAIEYKGNAEAQLGAQKIKAEVDLNALKAKYDYDLAYTNSQVKKYLEMMGRSPESRKRETFLNLFISYISAAEIARSSPLPMTSNEKRNAISNLQQFISGNLELSQQDEQNYGLILVIEPKDKGYRVSVDCGGILRFIPGEVTDPLTEKIKVAYEKKIKSKAR